ncbi:ABC transporter ATP-binding protein [Ekhidna sp. MALMAid0563]|uniref:ABC transporter ATP-binding protein n=1 Tax=Ekhidna sp. MALMAid0563 TaxID=3143937 RepID=UPI0032DFCF2E
MKGKNQKSKPAGLTVLKEILGIIWSCSKSWTIYRFTLSVLNGVLPLGTLYLIKQIVDEIVDATQAVNSSDFPYQTFIYYIALWLGLILLTTLLNLLLNYISEIHNHLISNHMQGMIQDKALAVEYRFYDTDKYHDVFHRAQREANTRPQRLLNDLSLFASNGASLLILSSIFLSLHWLIGIVFITIAIPTALVQFKYVKNLHKWKIKTTQLERRANYINQLATFKIYAKENRIFKVGSSLREMFIAAKEELLKGNLKILNNYLKATIGTSLIETLFLGGIFGYVIYQTGSGMISVGAMVMYFQAFQRGQKAMKDLLFNVNRIFEQRLFLTDLYEFLHLNVKTYTSHNREEGTSKRIDHIDIQNLHFSYYEESAEVLKNINLSVKKGEILAIVGENGSGKTTLMKLLCKLHQPSKGKVLINGKNYQEIYSENYWNEISVLFQDFSKYNLNVAFNVALNERVTNENSMYRATNLAGATSIVKGLKDNFNTKLGKEFKGGTELSGGQYQRMALSRALFKDSSLLLLDEPTSFIDGKAEKVFLDQLQGIAKDKIVILISHKLSNIVAADKICVMHNGEIVEYGTHQELVTKAGHYYQMFEPQLVAR